MWNHIFKVYIEDEIWFHTLTKFGKEIPVRMPLTLNGTDVNNYTSAQPGAILTPITFQ